MNKLKELIARKKARKAEQANLFAANPVVEEVVEVEVIKEPKKKVVKKKSEKDTTKKKTTVKSKRKKKND